MEIKDIKAQLSILEVAEKLGIKPDRYGKALCPFHDDKTPSLQFSKDKDICTCFSANCTAGTMDIVRLTEKKLNLTTHQALLQLTAWAGPLGMPGQAGKKQTQNGQGLSKTALLAKVFLQFENALRAVAVAKASLGGRGLVQAGPRAQGIEAGYNNGSFHHGENSYLIGAAVEHGLLRPNARSNKGGHQVFAKGCLAFPLKDKQRQVTGLYFRETDEKKENKHYYLKDRQGLYPGYPEAETRKLVITEAVIDAASLLMVKELAKEYAILAAYGTNGLVEEHLQAIKELEHLQETIFFFDGDAAGKEGAQRQAAKVRETRPDIAISFVETPEGEDVNSLYVNHKEQAAGLFQHLLKKRKPFLFSKEPLSIEAPSAENKKGQGQQPTPKAEQATLPFAAAKGLDSTNAHRLVYQAQGARYIVQGGIRPDLDSLKVTLLIEPLNKPNPLKYRNKIDLYENKQLERTAKEAADKLGLRPDLTEIELSRLTDLLETERDKQQGKEQDKTAPVTLDNATATKCKDFLTKPALIKRLNELIGQSGVVGEENSRIFLFAIAISYKMPEPLHALIQGSSGSGKTHLMSKISGFVPQDDRKTFTRVTESSLYNFGMYDLCHKLICLEDLDGVKEDAMLAWRELQSKGEISSATTGQDEKGKNKALETLVYGPIASLACTTRGEVYEDNMSRCFLIAVDESGEQTKRVITYQNKKASGQIDRQKEEQYKNFICNLIRLLKPFEVVNPYAQKVQLPEEAQKIRRLNDLYLNFVKVVTLLNQYRRKQDKRGRLIAEKEDLATAAEIMFDSIVLKIDELDGGLRLFYEKLKGYVRAKGGQHHLTFGFSQIEIRQALNISKTQLQRHINSLIELEYVQVTGGHINKGYRYKISHWDSIEAIRAKVKRHLQGQLDQLEIL